MLNIFLISLLAQHKIIHPKCDQEVINSCQLQPLVPIIKVGVDCPFGFLNTKDSPYCVPINKDVLGVIPVYSKTLPKDCPPGYRKNRGYCQATAEVFKNAIPKIGLKCPKKYYSNNAYCFEICD